MPKITFEMHIESEEVPQAHDMLRDVVEAFEFPEYEITVHGESGNLTTVGGEKRGIVNLPPVGGRALGEDVDSFGQWVAEAFPDWALDDEAEDETDPCFILPGQVLQLENGLVYQVFSTDANGRVILDQLEELTDSDTLH